MDGSAGKRRERGQHHALRWPSESRTRPGPAVSTIKTHTSSMLPQVKDTNAVPQSRLQAGFRCLVTPVMLCAARFAPTQEILLLHGSHAGGGFNPSRCWLTTDVPELLKFVLFVCLRGQSGVSSLSKLQNDTFLFCITVRHHTYITKYMFICKLPDE